MKLNRAEIWLVVVAVLFAATPWMAGFILRPSGWQYFPTFMMASGDTAVYYRYIDEGRSGGPFMSDGFTTDPHPAILWQPLWWILGQFAEIVAVSTPTIFFVARIIGALILALTCMWAARRIFQHPIVQSLAAWLGYFGAGLGGLWAVLFWRSGEQITWPYDLWVSEGYPWLSSLASPHFLFITAGLLFVFVGTEYAWSGRWVRWLAGPAFLFVTSMHPFHLLTFSLIWLLLTAWDFFQTPDKWRQMAWRRFRVWVWAIPTIVYYVVTAFEPIVAERAAQNVNPTYTWPMLIGTVPLIVLTAVYVRRNWKGSIRPLTVWVAVLFLMVFLPFHFQRRFFQPPIILLGFLAAPLAVEWLKKKTYVRTVVLVVGILMVVSPIWVTVMSVKFVWLNARASVTTFSYQSPAYVELVQKMKQHPEWSPVLTGRLNGNILAAHDPIQVFAGHGVETLRYQKKIAQVDRFYRSMSAAEQQDFVQKNKLCSVIFTPYEKKLGEAFPGGGWAGLRRIYEGPNIQLFTTGVCNP